MRSSLKIYIVSIAISLGLVVFVFYLDVANGNIVLSQLSWPIVYKFLTLLAGFIIVVNSYLHRVEERRSIRLNLKQKTPTTNNRQLFKVFIGAVLIILIQYGVPVLEIRLEQNLSDACIIYHRQHGHFPSSEEEISRNTKVPKIFFKYNTVFPTEPGRCDLLVFDSLRYVSVQPTISGQYQVTKQVLPIEQLLPSRYQDQS